MTNLIFVCGFNITNTTKNVSITYTVKLTDSRENNSSKLIQKM